MSDLYYWEGTGSQYTTEMFDELLAACEAALLVLMSSDDREHFEAGQTIQYVLDRVKGDDGV